MEIRDLSEEEQLALVGLIELVAEANRNITEEEQEEISRLAEVFGEERYRELVEAADRTFADEEALRRHLQSIERPEARELIFGLALETALSDAEGLAHTRFLDWLRQEWKIPVEIRSS